VITVRQCCEATYRFSRAVGDGKSQCCPRGKTNASHEIRKRECEYFRCSDYDSLYRRLFLMIPELDACLPARRTSTQLADYLPFQPSHQPHPTAHHLLQEPASSASVTMSSKTVILARIRQKPPKDMFASHDCMPSPASQRMCKKPLGGAEGGQKGGQVQVLCLG
jgi:hypothetical protein